MTIRPATPATSANGMETRRAMCRACRTLADDVGDLGTCLFCTLKASGAVCVPEPPRPRRTPQPLSLEAQLRRSISQHRSPASEEPWF